MSFGTLVLVVFIGALIGLWLISHIVEALRPMPQAPEILRWAPDIPIHSIEIGSCRLRYVKAGRGPNLVLLHTLRTQLDLFEKVVPELAKHFTVRRFPYRPRPIEPCDIFGVTVAIFRHQQPALRSGRMHSKPFRNVGPPPNQLELMEACDRLPCGHKRAPINARSFARAIVAIRLS
jgi:hypothetical protein